MHDTAARYRTWRPAQFLILFYTWEGKSVDFRELKTENFGLGQTVISRGPQAWWVLIDVYEEFNSAFFIGVVKSLDDHQSKRRWWKLIHVKVTKQGICNQKNLRLFILLKKCCGECVVRLFKKIYSIWTRFIFRTIKICIFRRRLLLLSLAAISVVFVLMSRESGQNRRYVKPVREKVYYNLMEENKHMPHHLEKCTLG